MRMIPRMARVPRRFQSDVLHTFMHAPMPRACEDFSVHVA